MTEHEHQVALFRWAALYEREVPELALLYANPLGGKRDWTTGRKLKREGVKKGIPDITLPVARQNHHGLYIEMKAGRNKPTASQRQWLTALNAQNYAATVCYGWQAAAIVICDYLGLEEIREALEL